MQALMIMSSLNIKKQQAVAYPPHTHNRMFFTTQHTTVLPTKDKQTNKIEITQPTLIKFDSFIIDELYININSISIIAI